MDGWMATAVFSGVPLLRQTLPAASSAEVAFPLGISLFSPTLRIPSRGVLGMQSYFGPLRSRLGSPNAAPGTTSSLGLGSRRAGLLGLASRGPSPGRKGHWPQPTWPLCETHVPSCLYSIHITSLYSLSVKHQNLVTLTQFTFPSNSI